MRCIGALLVLLSSAGCGSAYTVVIADEMVRFEPATWHVAPVDRAAAVGDDVSTEVLDAGLMSGLMADAGEFRFDRRGGADRPFSLRVVIERASTEGGGVSAEVSVSIVGAREREVGRLRMSVSDEGEGALARLGEEIGRRVMIYIHNHERYRM